MITRRRLIQRLLGASAAFSGIGSARPVHSTPARAGRAQVNLWFPYNNVDFPFIDCARMMQSVWHADGADEDHYALMDNDGYPMRMPRGAGALYKEFTRLYLTGTEKWVVTWRGSGDVTVLPIRSTTAARGTVRVIAGGTTVTGVATNFADLRIDAGHYIRISGNQVRRVQARSSQTLLTIEGAWDQDVAGGTLELLGFDAKLSSSRPNRKEYVYSSPAPYLEREHFGVQISIMATTEGNHVRDVKVFRASHENLLNAGQIFAPHFLDRYRGWGRIRFMDWQWTNENQQMRWAHRSLPTDHSWVGGTLRKAFYCGTATQRDNEYVTAHPLPDDPSSWVNGQQVTCRLTNRVTIKDVTSFSKENPAKVGVAAHGYATGTGVQFIPGLMGTSDFERFTSGRWFIIAVVDDDHFTLDDVDSTSWARTYPGGGKVCKEVRLKAGQLPSKRVMSRHATPASVQRFAANDLRQFTYYAERDALVQSLGPMSGGASGADQSTYSTVPLELMVALANDLQVDPWFCIPHMADTDWVENFAILIRDKLNPERTASIEFSNEVWNFGLGFSQTGFALNMARHLWPDKVEQFSFDNVGVHNWYGKRYYEVMSVLNRVFVGQMHRVNKVFTCQAAAYAHNPHVLHRFEAPLAGLPTMPISLANSVAIAPYYEAKRSDTSNAEQIWKYKQGGALREEAFAWLAQKLRRIDGSWYTVDFCKSTLFQNWKNHIVKYKVSKLTQYEGGWGIIPIYYPLTASSWNGDTLTPEDRDNFYFDFYNSEHFAPILIDNFNNFLAAGGEYPSQYTLVGYWGSSGMWGVVRGGFNGVETPTYSALRAFNDG